MTRRDLAPLRALAVQIAKRHGLSYRALLSKAPGSVVARHQVIQLAAGNWSSVEIATALRLHHTTVLWRLNRLPSKPLYRRRSSP